MLTILPEILGFWTLSIVQVLKNTGPVIEATLSKGPNRIGFFLRLRTETDPVSETSCSSLVCFLIPGRWIKSKNPISLKAIHHRQNPIVTNVDHITCMSPPPCDGIGNAGCSYFTSSEIFRGLGVLLVMTVLYFYCRTCFDIQIFQVLTVASVNTIFSSYIHLSIILFCLFLTFIYQSFYSVYLILSVLIYFILYRIDLILPAALALGSTQPLTEMSTRNL
jgi:hypothetical protein